MRVAAEGVFDAPPERVGDVLLAYREQVGRIGRLSEVEVLHRGEDSLVVYQRINLPVVSDRDFNLRVRWGTTGDGIWISYSAIDIGLKPRRGVVRIDRHTGSWQLRPIQEGTSTLARFRTAIDLSGWLPFRLVHPASGKELLELFEDIRSILRPNRGRK